MAQKSVAAICVRNNTESMEMYANRSNDAAKHVSLLMGAIMNNYCKHCTC